MQISFPSRHVSCDRTAGPAAIGAALGHGEWAAHRPLLEATHPDRRFVTGLDGQPEDGWQPS